MTRIEPIYFVALLAAVVAAVVLQLVHLPQPWPAAIALNVYGVVAWPCAGRELRVSHTTYGGAWMALALVIVLLEHASRLSH